MINVIGEACAAKRYSNIADMNQSLSKTLVLLDDVDVLMTEDKGFWNSLSTIIGSSKCPIILTYTSK